MKKMKKKDLILVIESNPEILKFCKTVLEKNNYKVLTAFNTEDGLNLYRQEQNYINTVLLNLQLSGKAYFTTLPAFLAINPAAQIIGMSESVEFDELPAYFKARLVQVLHKPFIEKDLISLLEAPPKSYSETGTRTQKH
jgi:DNA-binding NtrC family response regulator